MHPKLIGYQKYNMANKKIAMDWDLLTGNTEQYSSKADYYTTHSSNQIWLAYSVLRSESELQKSLRLFSIASLNEERKIFFPQFGLKINCS